MRNEVSACNTAHTPQYQHTSEAGNQAHTCISHSSGVRGVARHHTASQGPRPWPHATPTSRHATSTKFNQQSNMADCSTANGAKPGYQPAAGIRDGRMPTDRPRFSALVAVAYHGARSTARRQNGASSLLPPSFLGALPLHLRPNAGRLQSPRHSVTHGVPLPDRW